MYGDVAGGARSKCDVPVEEVARRDVRRDVRRCTVTSDKANEADHGRQQDDGMQAEVFS